MPPASLVASLPFSLSNFNLSCSSCIRYFNSQYCSNMESACSSSDLETWIPPCLAVSLSQDYTLLRYHTWPQSLPLGTAYSGVVIFLALFIFSTFFLLYLLVSCSHLFLSFYRSHSLSSSNFVVFPAVRVPWAPAIFLPRRSHTFVKSCFKYWHCFAW